MLTVMLAAVALLADTTPAAAAAPAQTTAPAAQPAKQKKPDDIICHKEATLGTSIPTKVCYSRAEYEANKAESRRTLEHVQNNIGIRGQ
jgi:invasion protein IalB